MNGDLVFKNRDILKIVLSFQNGKKMRELSWERIIERGLSQALTAGLQTSGDDHHCELELVRVT